MSGENPMAWLIAALERAIIEAAEAQSVPREAVRVSARFVSGELVWFAGIAGRPSGWVADNYGAASVEVTGGDPISALRGLS